jgi:hypothetical protein
VNNADQTTAACIQFFTRRLRPDMILSSSTPATAAIQRETRTIPIVFVLVVDPIAPSFAATLAHPGGNITGSSNLEPSFAGKWLQLLATVRDVKKWGRGGPPVRYTVCLGRTKGDSRLADVSRAQRTEQVIRTYFQACKDADVKPCCMVVN